MADDVHARRQQRSNDKILLALGRFDAEQQEAVVFQATAEAHLRVSIFVEQSENALTEWITAGAAEDGELADRRDADALRNARTLDGLHPRIEARRLTVY